MTMQHSPAADTPEAVRPAEQDELSDRDLEAVSAGASKKCNDGIGEGGARNKVRT